ncbi:hypothetical protein GCM10028791_02050 [Echinicola sediminis]
MSTLRPHITIPKIKAQNNDLDFDFLRKEGINYIEQFGSKLWTDYNTHDPGITMLEVLCYAITDLGHRIDLPIADLMSQEGKKDYQGQFYKATATLPSAATTALDIRKIMIDIPGIKNCWVKKAIIPVHADLKQQKLSYDAEDFKHTTDALKTEFNLKGLYKLLVETQDAEKELSEDLQSAIYKTFHAHRNLCEDLISVEKVSSHPISICANVEVLPEADEEFVHAQIIIALEDYLAPAPQFYSLKEMTDKGYPTEQIFEGPLLDHGFIDLQELMDSELRKEVRLSDIINLIMKIKGVKLVKEITMDNCNTGDEKNGDNWIICVPENKKPKLCDKTTINYFKGILPVNLNKNKAASYKNEILLARKEQLSHAAEHREPPLPEGVAGPWGHYDSIQHNFPETYGLSDKGLPKELGPERHAKAKQLKGYLMFFDQILASYFKHLEKIKEVLSLDQKPKQSYFTQAVKDIKGFNELIKEEYEDLFDDDESLSEALMGLLDEDIARRNQLLDHLLARFAEQFGNYAFLMKLLYGESTDELVLQHKQELLKEYDVISRERGEAFNYYEQEGDQLWNTKNVSGVQKRIARLAGIRDYSRRKISDSPVEIYKYENINGNWVYRWRIRDEENKIILSATVSYDSYNEAGQEMYFSILKILETREKDIEALKEISFGTSIKQGSFHIHKTATSEKFSFDVIDPEIENEDDTDYIIAKQFKYYAGRREVVDGILALISFIKYKFTEEGIFLIEHILLRPNQKDNAHAKTQAEAGKDYTLARFMPFCSDDFELCQNIDPYSFRVSIVLPGYTYRFANKDFRDYLENLIREELPAHIVAKICWIGYREGEEPEIPQEDVENPTEPIFKENQLVRFEKAYKAFLLEHTDIHQRDGSAASLNKYNKVLNELITILTGLHTIYPSGRLYNCQDEEEDLAGKIILGKTNLGTL